MMAITDSSGTVTTDMAWTIRRCLGPGPGRYVLPTRIGCNPHGPGNGPHSGIESVWITQTYSQGSEMYLASHSDRGRGGICRRPEYRESGGFRRRFISSRHFVPTTIITGITARYGNLKEFSRTRFRPSTGVLSQHPSKKRNHHQGVYSVPLPRPPGI